MIGTSYWVTGVMLVPFGDGCWGARIDFYDDGFCDQGSTEGAMGAPNPWDGDWKATAQMPPVGHLRTRYVSTDYVKAVYTLLEDGVRLGFTRCWDELSVYVPGDGEDPEVPLPGNWQAVQAEVQAALRADPVLPLRYR